MPVFCLWLRRILAASLYCQTEEGLANEQPKLKRNILNVHGIYKITVVSFLSGNSKLTTRNFFSQLVNSILRIEFVE